MSLISRLTRNFVLALFSCALFVSLGEGAMAAAASPGRVRLGTAPRHPAGSKVVGALPADTPIRATVTLKPRDPVALEAYANSVSTPGSSTYRHYLTVAEFRQRFGPTAQQIAAVVASLRAHGLRPGAVTPNGLAIPVRTSVAAIAKAFSTSFQRVALRSGRKAFANASAPALDSSIVGLVQGVIGLNSLAIPRPLALHAAHPRVSGRASPQVATGGPQPCSTATSAAPGQSAYTADQLASAYGFSGLYGAGDKGAGQTVAIFELEPNFPTDITAFKSCYGITTGTVSYTQVDGGPGSSSAAAEDGIETELDIENVIGLAPGANVHVYQGPYYLGATDSDVYDTYNAMVTSSAQVLSTSWGLCEQDDPSGAQSESTLFQEAATQGQSVFAASGDSGSEDCGDTSLAVDDPASQPYVTGAGGTSLTSLGPPPTESVWNDECSDGPCGGGGGISTLWKMPSYQSGAPAGLNVINAHSSRSPCHASVGNYCREVPDVSADADVNTGYLVYWDGNGNASDGSAWIGIGGTSGAAPLWAGLMADVNASALCSAPVGFANPALYNAAAAAYSSDFNEVTSGNNDITGTNGGLYPAGAKYDMASGLGTPNAYDLTATLCGDPVVITYPGARTNNATDTIQLPIQATDTAGKTISSYSATGLPDGLQINSSTGEISGSPTTLGTYDVIVTVTDSGGAKNTAEFPWTILSPVTLSNPGTQTSIVGTTVSKQINGSDSGHKPLSYSSTGLPDGLSINSSTGLISGVPTTPGTYTATVTASDGTVAYDASVQFTWTVNPVAVSVTNPGNQVGIVGIAANLQAHASDNNGGALTYAATGLPPGLSIAGTTGLIAGTPTTPGTYPVTLTATDGGTSQSSQFSWTISAATVAVANPGNQTRRVGTPARLQINATDNNGGALSYSASGLPPGLSIDRASGLITGKPSSAGRWTVAVRVADGPSTASTTFAWTVSGPPKAGGSLKGVTRGKPKLSLALNAGTDAPGINKLVISLPNGLSFAHRKSVLGRGIHARGGAFKLTGGRVTITWASAQSSVHITITSPALRTTRAVGHRKNVTVGLQAFDATGFGTPIHLKLKPA